MKMFYQPLFYQSSGDIFRVFLQGKLIDQTHTNQIPGLHLNRQTATGSSAVVTQFRSIFRPGAGIFEIGILPWELQHDVLS